MGKKVVIQKVDLDTVLTAYLLDVTEMDEIVVVRARAALEDLADPGVICVECGGSGQVERNNFDHHDTDFHLPPACVQAYRMRRGDKSDALIERLVDYVAALDTQGPEVLRLRSNLSPGSFPTLSDVFAGMLLLTDNARTQLLCGIAIVQTLVDLHIDPFAVMPDLPKWRAFVEAKRRNNEEIRKVLQHARFFTTRGGLRAGFVEADVFGVLGALYGMGCEIAIAYSPHFKIPGVAEPVPKYTVAGKGIRVDGVLQFLNAMDPGWGGPTHGTIIGSPREGSRLRPEQVIKVITRYM